MFSNYVNRFPSDSFITVDLQVFRRMTGLVRTSGQLTESLDRGRFDGGKDELDVGIVSAHPHWTTRIGPCASNHTQRTPYMALIWNVHGDLVH